MKMLPVHAKIVPNTETWGLDTCWHVSGSYLADLKQTI